tara:strand:+ start:336 stop:983 length:648 start_codon:yes stop_codon:yes gene_type:complete
MGLIQHLATDPALFFSLVITLIFSLVLHEVAHGYVAYKCGDSTAYYQGRLNLNPLNHLDPIGSLMILFIGFGWAKPVPVNSSNLRNPREDMIKVAIAGPATNLILAIIAVLICKIFIISDPSILNSPSPIIKFFWTFMYINLALCIFNMLPIPPLDGSRLLSFETQYRFQQYGPMVLFGLIILGQVTGFSVIGEVMRFIMSPIVDIFESFLITGL